MIFSKDVVKFKIKEVDVIGNVSNGSIIGLNANGAKICDRMFGEDIAESEIQEVDSELMNGLLEGGFFDEEEDRSIYSAYLHVTQRCNLNCLGCYSYDNTRNHLADPSLENLKKAITDLSKMGVKVLVISGGEPFFRKDIVEIARFAKEVGHIQHLQIITNGTVTRKETIEAIKPYVDGIAVSFDGYNAENPTFIRDKGIFDRLIESVKTIKASGIKTNILPTIHGQNCHALDYYMQLAKDLGVEISFSLLTCSPYNETFKDYIPNDEQLDQMGAHLTRLGLEEGVQVVDMPISGSIDTRKSCEVGQKIVSIGADGTVYPCHMLHERELAMGNVFNESLEDIMKGRIAMDCKSLDVSQFSGCGECEHRYLCGGGCRARSYYKYKNLESHDYYCKMTYSFFESVSQQVQAQYGN